MERGSVTRRSFAGRPAPLPIHRVGRYQFAAAHRAALRKLVAARDDFDGYSYMVKGSSSPLATCPACQGIGFVDRDCGLRRSHFFPKRDRRPSEGGHEALNVIHNLR